LQQSIRGRKPSHTFRRSKLSADAKILIELLKKQPQTADEIRMNAKINKPTFYRALDVLKDVEIKINGESVPLIKRDENGYALWFYDPIEKKVEEAILDLISPRGFTTLPQIAYEVGKPLNEIEGIIYTVAKRLGLTIAKMGGETALLKEEFEVAKGKSIFR
jgi:hypothetical protein